MKRPNPDESLWFLILLGYGAYIAYLLRSGDMLYFINPRLNVFMVASASVFFLLACIQIPRLFLSGERWRDRFWMALFALPMLLGVAVAPKGLHENIALNKGFFLSGATGGPTSFLDAPRKKTEPMAMLKKRLVGDIGSGEPTSAVTEDGVFEVDAAHFDTRLQIVEDVPEAFADLKVRIAGFVQRRSGLPDERFFVVRMLIVCCAADSLVRGLMVEWPEGASFAPGEWVEAEGVVVLQEFYDDWFLKNVTVPMIRATRVERSERPSSIYVYPASGVPVQQH
jgi:putative membrane protein